MEKPIKMDDLAVPLFSETSKSEKPKNPCKTVAFCCFCLSCIYLILFVLFAFVVVFRCCYLFAFFRLWKSYTQLTPVVILRITGETWHETRFRIFKTWGEKWVALLMAEILHHLRHMKPCKKWDKLPINWCRISSINSIIPQLEPHKK